MLLEDDGGESLACNLQEEDGEDDKESEGLALGANLSALKSEPSVFDGNVGDGLGGGTEREGKTHRHGHPSAMGCLKGWMDAGIGLGTEVQDQR